MLLTLFDLLIVGWLPSSEVFLRALENAVPKTNLSQIADSDIGGIIILGGAIQSGMIGLDRGEVPLQSSAERVTKALELIRKYPNLPFIFSGYSGRLNPKGLSEADAFKQLIAEQGLSQETEKTAHYENQSRNTYENVLYLRPMMQDFGARSESGAIQPWLLITSASHMYRAEKIFQMQGIEVIPVPVDYQTANSLNWTSFDLEDGTQNWHKLVHEVVGLLAYWITGKL